MKLLICASPDSRGQLSGGALFAPASELQDQQQKSAQKTVLVLVCLVQVVSLCPAGAPWTKCKEPRGEGHV